MAVVRGCGTREKGGIYLEVKVARFSGRPIEEFLGCPPTRVDPAAMGIALRGITVRREPDGSSHAYDWVGDSNYENVTDFIEEARRHGVSRRVQSGLDFSLLTPETRHVLIHPRAYIENAAAYHEALQAERREYASAIAPVCPRSVPHDPADGWDGMCSALWWEDIDGGEIVYDPMTPPRSVDRRIGGTVYRARRRPDFLKPVYTPAIFMVLRATRLTVIRDPDGGHEERVERASASSLPVIVEDV